MADRKFLNHGIRLASALALMLAVLTSPIRPSLSTGVPTVGNHLRRNFANPSSSATRMSATTLPSHPERVKALRPECDEELTRAALPACRSFARSVNLPRALAPRPAAGGSSGANCPLRC